MCATEGETGLAAPATDPKKTDFGFMAKTICQARFTSQYSKFQIAQRSWRGTTGRILEAKLPGASGVD